MIKGNYVNKRRNRALRKQFRIIMCFSCIFLFFCSVYYMFVKRTQVPTKVEVVTEILETEIKAKKPKENTLLKKQPKKLLKDLTAKHIGLDIREGMKSVPSLCQGCLEKRTNICQYKKQALIRLAEKV